MPFPDEMGPVVLVRFRESWRSDFTVLAQRLGRLRLADVGAIDHIGSTAIPRLRAKDVIDVQVRLPDLPGADDIERLMTAGFRHRPEEWNQMEATRTGPVAKVVMASRPGERPVNIHFRVAGTTGARDALLFRDYLRADATARHAWDSFKWSILEGAGEVDLFTYGQAKQPAWHEVMGAADDWAARRGWEPAPMQAWPGPALK